MDHERKRVSLSSPSSPTSAEINRIIADTLAKAREKDVFNVLKGWRDELYPIGRLKSNQVSIERAGSALFGIVTHGVHLTAYVKDQSGIKIWVPRRTRHKSTYGGMLDNTVAGGISSGEGPFECLIREAEEEASFSEDLIRSAAKPCGAISYFYIRDRRAGGETGLLQPEVQYVYDMEVGPNIIPSPGDDEVEDFSLLTIDEVKGALAEGRFKPNCALVMLDFFIRHGFVDAENEEDFTEIVSRIHRRLPFPTY